MFNEHCPTNNQLQIGYAAYHASVTAPAIPTGTGLLTFMVKLEKTAKAQGSEIFPSTLLAAKAAAVLTVPTKPATAKQPPITAARTDVKALLSDASLTPLQQEVLATHLKAALSAVNFAGAHPTESKSRTHFCPVHGFNDTHSERDCKRCQSLKK